MIICSAYPSDDNDQLKDVQHELYWQLVPQLFATARAELLRADEILDTKVLIAEKARAIKHLDHRVLQDAHDIMAAAFRHGHDDGGQLRLLETEAERNERYRAAWLEWFETELAALAKIPRFVKSTVQAVVLANTELGYTAERDVGELLVSRYGFEHWGFADGYAKRYRQRWEP